MRFSFRTLVSAIAAILIATITATVSRPASAQDPAAKTDGAPKSDAPAATSLTTPAEAVDPQPLLAKGEEALKAADYPAAMAAFDAAYKAAVQAGQQGGGTESLKAQLNAVTGRGRAETGLKEYDAAEKDFRSVLQDAANEPSILVPALIALGKLKLETGHPDEALEQYRDAVKSDPANVDALFGYGKSLVQLSQGAEAILTLTRVVTADPKNAEAFRLRGSAYASVSKNKQAIDDLQKSIELNPDDYETYFTLGILFLRAENYQSAVDQIGKAIEHYKPKPGEDEQPFYQGYLTRASAYIELGKKAPKDSAEQKAAYQASLDETQKMIQQLDEKNPAHSRVLAAALFSRGIAERMLGQLGPAIRTFTHAMELRTASAPDDSTGPFLTDAYYRRGICFHLIGEEKMAISDFESAAHLDVSDPRANLWEGFTYAKIGDYQQALRAYGDAIAASDRFTPAYYNRGLAYMMMGNYKKAIIDFNDAIRLEPANAEYYFKRGLAYMMLSDYKKASDSFSAAIEFDKNHAGAHRQMADALQKLGRNELAAQYRQKADQLTPAKKNAK